MRNKYLSILALIVCIVYLVIAITPSIAQYRDRYSGPPSLPKVGTDTYLATKTIVKTISVLAVSADDFQFPTPDAENNAEQTVDFGVLIPAYAEILSAQVRCTEALVSSGADPDLITAMTLGTSDSGDEILAAGTPNDLNDLMATAAGECPEVVATNAARHIWVGLQPTDFWSTLSAGRWAVIITYIDNGAVYDKSN